MRQALKIEPEELFIRFYHDLTKRIAAGDLQDFILEQSHLRKDLSKVNFDMENRDWNSFGSTGSELYDTRLGPRYNNKNALSYIGCCAGGDWQIPVFFIIYLDRNGRDWRGYVPQHGNIWNYDTKEAIGNDEDADCKFLTKQCKKLKICPPVEVDVDDAEWLFDAKQLDEDIAKRIRL